MGVIYEIGGDLDCGPRNDREAFKWFKKAAEGGNPEAEEEVAGYYTGLDMDPDYSEALRWFRKAAEDGMVTANYRIGQIYQQGWGVPQDYAEAARWFRKGAERGDFDAQEEMGHIYEIGQGVPQDKVEAHMWWNLAAAHEPPIYQKGVRSAASFRDELAAKMTATEVAEAQKRAREWKPKQ
jgi:TPR repeat protein